MTATEDIAELRGRVGRVETALAVRRERDKHIDQRFDYIDSRLDKVSTYARWLITLVMGGIVLAFVQFMIEGGLSKRPIPGQAASSSSPKPTSLQSRALPRPEQIRAR